MKMTKSQMLSKLEKIERERALDVKIEIQFIDYETKACVKNKKLHNKQQSNSVLKVII